MPPAKPGPIDVQIEIQPATPREGLDTPTRLRKDYDVNSPRAKPKKITFPEDDKAAPAALTGLATQVDRPDKRKVDDEEVETSCCSCLWSPSKEEQNMFDNMRDADGNPETPDVVVVDDTEEQQPEEAPPEEAEYESSEAPDGLLGPISEKNKGRKTLVLDLDETLVHSSFKPIPNPDLTVPIEIEGVTYNVYVLKRPFVDKFLTETAKHYEIAIFTASLGKYANPLLDQLDTGRVIEHRLFRESCVIHGGAYVKDLSKLGRKMKNVIFIDNSPLSYAFQPRNAVPTTSWFDDPDCTELNDILPVLTGKLKECEDVRTILDANGKSYKWLCEQAYV